MEARKIGNPLFVFHNEILLLAFNSCIYCTTCYHKCGRIGTKLLFFFIFIDKKLANRISYQIWYKRFFQGKFGGGGGVQIYEGCPYPPVDLDGADPDLDRGPNPRRVQIKSAATPEQLRTFIPSPKRNLQAYIASSKSDKISQKFFIDWSQNYKKFFFCSAPPK